MVCFYKGQIPPNAPGGGLTTFDRLLSPNQGRFALLKVKSPTSLQGGGGGGGGGVSRNNDRRIRRRAINGSGVKGEGYHWLQYREMSTIIERWPTVLV